MVLGSARLQDYVPAQPSLLEDEPRRGGELAKVLAQKTRRFLREKPIGLRLGLRIHGRLQKFARHLAAIIDLKQIVLQGAQKKFRFPLGERRTEAHPRERPLPDRCADGVPFFLQPGFEVSVQPYLSQLPQDIVLPGWNGWRLVRFTPFTL